jgi:predicted dehydrogenase
MSKNHQTYRVAIIGCGARGNSAVNTYGAHPRTTVVGICDLFPDKLNTAGDRAGLAASARFSDHEQMIRQTKPDIVVVATQTDVHFPLAMQVLELGAHVDVEKPHCEDLEQADALLARSAETGFRVAVHHQYRRGVVMRALLRVVEEGRLGRIHHLEGNCKGYYGGYGLMDIGCHLLNNFVKFGGRCRSVMAFGQTGGHPVTPADAVRSPEGMGVIIGEDLTAMIQLDSGVTATLIHHRLPNVGRPPLNSMVEVTGTEGHLLWKSNEAWYLPHGRFVPGGTYDQWEQLPLEYPAGFDASMSSSLNPGSGMFAADDYLYVDEYVRALDEGREHECSGPEVTHVLETMMAIFESAATGTRVDLPQAGREHPLLKLRREHGLGEPPPVPRPWREWLVAEDERIAAAKGAVPAAV